jgi:hypothetical protein
MMSGGNMFVVCVGLSSFNSAIVVVSCHEFVTNLFSKNDVHLIAFCDLILCCICVKFYV